MQDNRFIYKFYYGWWKNIDKTIFLIIIFLFILGLFFSLASTSLIASDKLDTNSYFFFFKHLVYIGLAIFVIIFFSSLSQKNLFRISILLFFVSLFFLALVPVIGVEVKSAKRWLDLYLLPRFQPIELLKPFVIILLATILSSKKKFHIYFKYFLSFIVILPIVLLLIIQPDIGQTLLVFLSWLSLVFISGISLFVFFTFFGTSFIALLCLIFFIPRFEYIRNRIDSFINPSTGTHTAQPEKAIVWRFKPSADDAQKGSVEAVEVTITRGISNGLLVEGPLKDDDKIVAAGAHLVKEGQSVSEWTKEGGL